MIAALLPCPFCGHEHPEFERMGDRRQSCIVICGNCGARHESGDEGSRNGSSWNQRSEPGQDGLRATLETALARIEDMLADDDGQAFKEARKFLESARQLAEQPGFVMVPVEVVKFLTGEGPLDGLWFGEHPFGLGGGKYWWRNHLPAARPLTASPTAPSTEASEPVGEREAFIAAAKREGFQGLYMGDGVNRKSDRFVHQMHEDMFAGWMCARNTPPPAPVLLSDAETRMGWMCATTFRHEVGEAAGGSTIYADLDDLKENVLCWDSCGVVQVEVRAIEQAIGRASREASK